MSKKLARNLEFAAVFGPVCLLTYFLQVENKPFFATSIASTFLIHMWTRPSRREFVLTIGIGLLLLAAFAGLRSEVTASVSTVSLAGIACLGLGSLAMTGAQAAQREGAARKAKLTVLVPAILLAVSSIIGALALLLTSYLHPKTFDLYLYAFDSSLGFQPSFWMGRLFAAFPPLAFSAGIVYAGVPLAIALLYALQITSPRLPPVNILYVFFGAGFAGLFLYQLFPATGPVFIFGPSFPQGPPAIDGRVLAPNIDGRAMLLIAVAPDPPRNAMPSVHTAWALLVWWNSRRKPTWVRILAALFLTLTVLATLGMGEHYLIDLVVAVPFTVALQAAFTTALPLSQAERSRPLIAGAVALGLWLIVLRNLVVIFQQSPVVPWAAILCTLIVFVRLEKQLATSCRNLDWQGKPVVIAPIL